MKFNKKLLPLIGIAAISATAMPLAMVMTSCQSKGSYSEEISDVTEYTPKYTPVTKTYSNIDEVKKTYLQSNDAPKIVADDAMQYVKKQGKQTTENLLKATVSGSQASKDLYAKIKKFNDDNGTSIPQLGKVKDITMSIEKLSFTTVEAIQGSKVSYTTRVTGTFTSTAYFDFVDRLEDGTFTQITGGATVAISYELKNVPYTIVMVTDQPTYLWFDADDLKNISDWSIKRVFGWQNTASLIPLNARGLVVTYNKEAFAKPDELQYFKENEQDQLFIESAFLSKSKIA